MRATRKLSSYLGFSPPLVSSLLFPHGPAVHAQVRGPATKAFNLSIFPSSSVRFFFPPFFFFFSSRWRERRVELWVPRDTRETGRGARSKSSTWECPLFFFPPPPPPRLFSRSRRRGVIGTPCSLDGRTAINAVSYFFFFFSSPSLSPLFSFFRFQRA